MSTLREDKQAFFAQYLGQFVLSVQYPDNSIVSGCEVSPYNLSELHQFKNAFIQLKPLSAITVEDLFEIAKIYGYNAVVRVQRNEFSAKVYGEYFVFEIFYSGEIDNDGNHGSDYDLKAYDFLRRREYLIPFGKYSTEQLIDMGWVKISTL